MKLVLALAVGCQATVPEGIHFDWPLLTNFTGKIHYNFDSPLYKEELAKFARSLPPIDQLYGRTTVAADILNKRMSMVSYFGKTGETEHDLEIESRQGGLASMGFYGHSLAVWDLNQPPGLPNVVVRGKQPGLDKMCMDFPMMYPLPNPDGMKTLASMYEPLAAAKINSAYQASGHHSMTIDGEKVAIFAHTGWNFRSNPPTEETLYGGLRQSSGAPFGFGMAVPRDGEWNPAMKVTSWKHGSAVAPFKPCTAEEKEQTQRTIIEAALRQAPEHRDVSHPYEFFFTHVDKTMGMIKEATPVEVSFGPLPELSPLFVSALEPGDRSGNSIVFFPCVGLVIVGLVAAAYQGRRSRVEPLLV